MLQDRLKLSERRACEIAGQHRSTQRHEPIAAPDDQALRRALRKIANKKPRWGYRRAHGHLLSEGWSINRKRVQRIWREEGLRVPARKRKRRRLGESTVDGANRLRAERPNHVWALDFQHDATADGRELKFLNVVDEFTRESLAIECDRTIDADQTVAVLERLASRRGAPENLRADNGPELTARVLAEWCKSGSTDTAYIDPGAPWQNGWIESFNARFRDEVLDVEEINDLSEARFLAAEWRRDYNEEHPHSALGMITPSRFAASWQRTGEANGSVNPELSEGVDR
jgi:putative transposase